MPTHTKIQTNDLPNNIGQTVVIVNANNTQKKVDVIALSADGKYVLVKHNKEYFYQPVAFDGTKILYTVNLNK